MDKEYMLNIIKSECMRDDLCLAKTCGSCEDIEECYMKATNISDHTFAESINYGGYDTEEEFWDNLLG